MSALEAYWEIDEKLQRLVDQSYRSICENLPMPIVLEDYVVGVPAILHQRREAHRSEVWEEIMSENGIKATGWISPVDRKKPGFCLVFDPRYERRKARNFLMIPEEIALKMKVLEFPLTK